MPRRGGQRSTKWCWTLNNYDEKDEERMRSTISQEVCSYILWGREIGENGTPHLQGFMVSYRTTLTALKRRIGIDALHLEIMKGSLEEAITYCKKDGDWEEHGTPPRQGQRSDLETIRNEIVEGKSELDIATNHFSRWVTYRRSFERYRELLRESTPREKPKVVVHWGPTGTGKTKWVHDYIQRSQKSLWIWGGDRWFDGYIGQDVALFDDFRGELSFGFLLRVLDRYRLSVPIKGGFANWTPTEIYITSNKRPEEWYNSAFMEESIEPLLRRIDEVREMN